MKPIEVQTSWVEPLKLYKTMLAADRVAQIKTRGPRRVFSVMYQGTLYYVVAMDARHAIAGVVANFDINVATTVRYEK